MDSAILWDSGTGQLVTSAGARVQGQPAWGRSGVIVGQMSTVKCALSTGAIHDKITGIILPALPQWLAPIWAFCESPNYNVSLRRINTKLNVATATLVKVPFDLAYWQKVAAEEYPNGLPEPRATIRRSGCFTGGRRRRPRRCRWRSPGYSVTAGQQNSMPRCG